MENKISNNMIECFTPSDRPYGCSFGEWTTRWWEWALSVPVSVNPVLDETGQNADINQRGAVWFLAGTVGDKNKVAYRSCEIPEGKAVLFPVINYLYADSPLCNETDLVDRVRKDIDDIVINEAIINGHKISGYRIKSDPILFELNSTEGNILEIQKDFTKASADGYWVFVKPLKRGAYEIYFHGACSGGQRNASAQYKITVK